MKHLCSSLQNMKIIINGEMLFSTGFVGREIFKFSKIVSGVLGVLSIHFPPGVVRLFS